ncbi:unnamed protein product [Closterium sp. NIES-64]|nr:unnamed protein product [Closterium sp. NIES-64]
MESGLTVRSDQHWHEVDRCLAYLANTRDTAQEFGGGPESLELVGYVDADDVGDKQSRTSTGGYVIVYGGAAVSWSSQRIKCATLLSTESEYVAATEAGKEGRRLRFLLAEFRQLDAGKPTVLRVDNKSAITVAEGMGLAGNLKHMERRQAWLQHMVKRGKFSLQYIPTAVQPADFLTKALHYPAFNRCSVAIGKVRLADVGNEVDDVQQGVSTGVGCWPRPRLGGADIMVGCEGSSRPAAVAVAVGAEVAEVAAEEEAEAVEVELVGVALRRGSAPVVVSASTSARVTSPPPQQLREWYAARQRGGGTGPCTYVLRTGDRAGELCGGAHPTQRCFGRLTDAWRHQFPEATEIPRCGELSREGVAIFDLDIDAIM